MEDGPGAGLATTRSSVDSNGFQATNHSWDPVVSRDGLFVAFDSNADDLVVGDTNTKRDVFVRDVLAGMTTRVSVGDDGSQASDHSDCASISADGELAGFTSAAADLVDGDLNTKLDVFVHHRSTGHAVRVHLAWDGSEADAESRSAVLTSSGSHVVFDSKATNLVGGAATGSGTCSYARSIRSRRSSASPPPAARRAGARP